MSEKTIIGEKIDLRIWNNLDTNYNASKVLRWFTDPEVMKYVGFFKKTINFTTIDEIRKFIAKLEDGIYFGIYTKDEKLIGETTLSHFNNSKCEFGIFIGEKEFWGRGIGGEVTKLVTDYGFNNLSIDRIVLSVASRNIAGLKVYTKAGFKEFNVIKNGRLIFQDGNFIPDDTIEMELIK